MFSYHNLVLFPLCNKILLDSYSHMLCFYSFFLFHDMDLELSLPLFLFLLKNHVVFIVFIPMTFLMLDFGQSFSFFARDCFSSLLVFWCFSYMFTFNASLPYWLLVVLLLTFDVLFPYSFHGVCGVHF